MSKTSLYRHYNANGNLLYVGIANSHLVRLGTHMESADWRDMISTVKVEHYNTREEALAAEKLAIETEEPLFNLVHAKKGTRAGMLRRAFHQIDLEEVDELIDDINGSRCSTYRNECLADLPLLAAKVGIDFDAQIKPRLLERTLPECNRDCPDCLETRGPDETL